ncbi:ABC transporter substrate-binding protein [Hydrogenophaga sp.]|uniref:ABC transporter substrate-binding protein n=1 Tax=Hydrogenophaga sp. TaxID=1904254 RepID=UPI00271BCEF9|nr:ABC transporter substrate-binding protein [Hydrogenophaga sp.]MDO9435189.1 ABC transporter substrate-binding protein [Hydrogenophaga sp.]
MNLLMRTAVSLACVVGVCLTGPARAAEETTMAIPATSLAFTVSYIADDLDLWGKHGMKVKSSLIKGVGAFNALVSKATEFTQSSGSSFTRASARGQKMLAIATTIDRPIVQIAFRKDLADTGGFKAGQPLAQRAKLLADRTIAVDAVNSIAHAYVLLVAQAGGVNPTSVRVVPMDPSSMQAALEAGRIDGFSMTLPWALPPVVENKAVMLASGPDGDPSDLMPFGHELVVTRPEVCAEKKQLCVAMGKVFAEATAYIHDKPAETQAILAKRFPALSKEVLAQSVEYLKRSTPRNAQVSVEQLRNVELYNVRAGLLKEGDRVKEFDDLFTNQYVR